MTRTAILNGRDIGAAQQATEAVLMHLLHQAGTDFETWAVLDTLADAGGTTERAPLVELLARRARTDAARIEAIVDGVEAAGLVRVTSPTGSDGDPAAGLLVLTDAGRARHRPLRAAVTAASESLFAAIPHSEQRAAHRVLEEVTFRARAWVADHAPSPAPAAGRA